jgi:signal transduction histidine kinase
MPHFPAARFRTRSFLLAYAAAWIVYAAFYVTIFTFSQRLDLVWAIGSAIVNVAPVALLGAVVLHLPQWLRWDSRRRTRFVLIHAVCATLFSLVSYTTLIGGLGLLSGLLRDEWRIVPFRGAALHWVLFQGVLLYAVIAGVAYAIDAYHTVREQERRAASAELRASSAEALRAAAELQALRARLHPHFIFNTLHTLQALVRYDPERAEDAIERLGALLRFSLGASDGAHPEQVTLAAEWEFVQDYLVLEELRLGNRLQVITNISKEAMNQTLPPLSVQPLVENAIKHSISPRSGGGIITIEAALSEGCLAIRVHDDGPGVDLDRLEHSKGHGLQLVRRRLALSYGSRASMKIESSADAGFAVTLALPAGSTAEEYG